MANPRRSSSYKSREGLTCSLCLEIFRSPKLLPCQHTFCEQCLKQLVERNSSDVFSCPSCRTETVVPLGGVSDFQNNQLIDPSDLERARNTDNCLIHDNKDLDFFCDACDQPICLYCKLTDHERHVSRDLDKAATTAQTQIARVRKRLEDCASSVRIGLEAAEKNEQAVRDKQAILRKAIIKKHTMLQNAIDKYREEAIAALDTVTEGIVTSIHADAREQRDNLEILITLEKRLQQTIEGDVNSKVISVARKMRSELAIEDSARALSRKLTSTVSRPVLRYSATADTTFTHLLRYLGSAARIDMVAMDGEVVVEEQFRCRRASMVDVHCLCPLDDGNTWISFDQHEASPVLLSHEGRTLDRDKEAAGRVTFVSRENGKNLKDYPDDEHVNTFAKSSKQIRLSTHRLKRGQIYKYIVTSEQPFKVVGQLVCELNNDNQLGFDTDHNELLFVVLEEEGAPPFGRRVRLYRRPEPDAIATYSPPVTPFQPSDVCFYTLGGLEVLLVADELNDAIHVVNVQDGRPSFLRFLAPGCPLLVQPTALNTDTRGRLWVACRGGRILTCTPVESSSH